MCIRDRDGIQAVAYGRIRYSDTDYARTERQRIILQKAFDKAKNADWATLNCLIQTIMPQLATNVDITDLIPLARNIAKFHIGETAGFPAARGEQDVGKIGDCVIPQTLEYNVKELHKFLFDEEDYQVPSNEMCIRDSCGSVRDDGTWRHQCDEWRCGRIPGFNPDVCHFRTGAL